MIIKINFADVHYRRNIMRSFTNDLNKLKSGTPFYGRETENGLKMALEFLKSLKADWLSENELKHAVRLSMYRGQITDHKKLTTK